MQFQLDSSRSVSDKCGLLVFLNIKIFCSEKTLNILRSGTFEKNLEPSRRKILELSRKIQNLEKNYITRDLITKNKSYRKKITITRDYIPITYTTHERTRAILEVLYKEFIRQVKIVCIFNEYLLWSSRIIVL